MKIFRKVCSVKELLSSQPFSKILGVNLSLLEHKLYSLFKNEREMSPRLRKEKKRGIKVFH